MSNAEILKQNFLNRLDEFTALRIANQQSNHIYETALAAVVLFGDMLDTYKNMRGIATHLGEGSPCFNQKDMFALGMHAIAIEHERLDQFLVEVHEDYFSFTPTQIMHGNGVTYVAHHLGIPQQHKPMLWDAVGKLLHTPRPYLTTHRINAKLQLKSAFMSNGAQFTRIIEQISVMDDISSKFVVNALCEIMSSAHVPADDPRRQLCRAMGSDVWEEATYRLRKIYEQLNDAMDESQRAQEMMNFFDVFAELDDTQKKTLLSDIDGRFQMMKSESIIDYDEAVIANATLLQMAIAHGFDAAKLFEKLLNIKRVPQSEFINALTSGLPIKQHDCYAGETEFNVLRASYLYLQDTEALLASGCNTDAVLALYVLKQDERFREVLMTTDRVETLLAHDLGM
ncbi:hypothetical protein [Pseudomonas sp. S1(2024)]|uniref:hypothetical protein n=1 Tax=Pseudomonas sp. S1(2024) TaxID=3390191 RepID=UPI00397B518B